MLIFIFGTAPSGFSQTNLVRNPSFEQYNYLPTSIGTAPGSIKYWNFASEQGSGDYYHADSPGKDYRTIDNYFGSEAPHSGKAYAGFCVTPIYREYLSSQLIMKLEKGKTYKFTMFVSKGDNEDVSMVKEIGVMFLSRSWILPEGLQMGLPPQIVFYQDSGFTQTNGWQELTAIYKAKGTEEWIYIGANEWKCDTCKSVPGKPRTENPGIFGPSNKQAHYYVDDVSIVEVTGAPIDTTIVFQPGKTYAFSNILFETNSAVLQDGTQPVLEPIVKYLREHPTFSVTISGHTDSIGDSRSNYVLSLNRAEAVQNYFIEQGISAERIAILGFGETKFVAPNSTAEGRALNRRVEFVFSESSGK